MNRRPLVVEKKRIGTPNRPWRQPEHAVNFSPVRLEYASLLGRVGLCSDDAVDKDILKELYIPVMIGIFRDENGVRAVYEAMRNGYEITQTDSLRRGPGGG